MNGKKNYTLLIADDEAMERNALGRAIGAKYADTVEIVEAVNGLDALEKFRTHKPDIVFCDIKMPGKNGLEVIREIKKHKPDQIAVFLSAYDYFDYAREAVSLGVQEYLLKPVSDDDVCALMQKLLDTLGKNRKRESASNAFKRPQRRKGMFSARLEKLFEDAAVLLETHYDEDLTLDNAAQQAKLSRFYFSKMFKLYWGKSFTDYLNEVRISKACTLLADPSLSIKEIAAACGFSHSNYFSRVFKQIQKLTPGEYRSNILN